MLSTKTRKRRFASYLGDVTTPAAPVGTVAPVISGTAQVGQTLTTTQGTWTGTPTPEKSVQWFAGGLEIPGAQGTTYVPVVADVGKTITVTVTGNSVAGIVRRSSVATSAVIAAVAPVNTVAPAITGTAQVGQTLTTTNGTWTGAPTPTYTREWKAAGAAISGATGTTYVPVIADIGKVITCTVTATNVAAVVTAITAATAAVIAA